LIGLIGTGGPVESLAAMVFHRTKTMRRCYSDQLAVVSGSRSLDSCWGTILGLTSEAVYMMNADRARLFPMIALVSAKVALSSGFNAWIAL
jgi:hypothetical protein